MKKTLSLIMAVLFVMSCLNVVVFADDTHAVAAIDSKTEVAIGEEFDVYVTLEDYADIKSLALVIDYDSTVLEQTTEAGEALLVTEGVLMSDYDGVSAVYASSSTLDAGIAAADGKVLKLSFKAIADGNSDITCAVTEEQASGSKVTYDAEKVNVVVLREPHAEAAVVCDAAAINLGDEFDVYVTLEDYANIKSLALVIGYDSTVLEQTTEADEALLVTEGVLMSDYDGVSAVYASSSTLDAGIAVTDGKVLKLSFKAIATGTATITCEVTEEKVSGAKDTYDAVSFEAGIGCLHEEYTSEVTKEASCVEPGVITYTCACGHTYTEETDLAEHTWGEATVTVEPTCTAEGSKAAKCEVCGTSDAAIVIPALGHTWGEVTVKVEATCTTAGEQSATCEVCGVSDAAIVIPALGHTYDEGVVTKEATCKEAGEKTFTCEVCGNVTTETIAKLAHTYGDAVVVEPTCTEAGSRTFTCTVCGDDVVETIKALGHKWGDWEVVEEATEDEEGLEQRTCSVCGEKETREIEKVEDHKWSALVNTIRLHALRQKLAKDKEDAKAEAEEEPVVIDEAIVEEAWVNPFVDIYESDSYYAAIEFVYENGLFKGVSEIEFAPATTMTRAMFVTVLGRLHGITEDYVGENTFADVVEGEWYAPYVVWAADNGIVLGYGDGTFGINDEITVEQAAVILARYTAFIELDVVAEYDLAADYADAADVSEWAAEAMTWAVAEGIYEGVEVGEEDYLFPQTPAARSLVATMLYNFAN